ncbi:MAG: 30S ribosomal protein S25e [Candidatus Bathyarchaeia archaeon]
MGGGKKKQTLSQIEKAQEKKPEKKKETKSAGSGAEKKAPAVVLPDLKSEKIIEEVKKLRVLTPYTVASRFNLRLSVAKDFLEELEKKGAIRMVSRSRNVSIYKSLD